MKTIYILIGPKGSGKTYIGKLIEKKLSIRFLSVEPIFIKIKGKRHNLDKDFIREGYELMQKKIHSILKKQDKVIIEQTGASRLFKELVRNLKKKYDVKLIRVKSSLKTCRERIEKRKSKNQIPITKELIEKVNKKSISMKHKVSFNIDNNKKLSNKKIIEKFKKNM